MNISKTPTGITRRNVSLLFFSISLSPKYRSGIGTDERKMRRVKACNQVILTKIRLIKASETRVYLFHYIDEVLCTKFHTLILPMNF